MRPRIFWTSLLAQQRQMVLKAVKWTFKIELFLQHILFAKVSK